jgi:hypothetical protein
VAPVTSTRTLLNLDSLRTVQTPESASAKSNYADVD